MPRTWVHRASLDARLAALEERVSLKAASEVLGVSACTLRSVLAHLEITPNRGQDGLTKARVTKVQLELVRSTLSQESRFTAKHLTLSGAAATLGLTPYRIHRELSSGTLRRARAVPERLRAGVVWITWASVRGHPRYEADRSPDLADGLSVTDAAHRAGVSEATIRRWLQDGSLASVRRGRRVWISAADLDGVLKLRRRTA